MQTNVAPAGQQVAQSGQQVIQNQQPQPTTSAQMNVARNVPQQSTVVSSQANMPQKVVQKLAPQATQNSVQQSVMPKSVTAVPKRQVEVQENSTISNDKTGANPKSVPTVNPDLTNKIVQNSN